MTKEELLGKVDVLLGGRAAEEVVFGEVSTGAHNDLQRATDIVRSIVARVRHGRDARPADLHAPAPGLPRRASALLPDGAREYSEATAEAVDAEMKQLMVTACSTSPS